MTSIIPKDLSQLSIPEKMFLLPPRNTNEQDLRFVYTGLGTYLELFLFSSITDNFHLFFYIYSNLYYKHKIVNMSCDKVADYYILVRSVN